MLDKPGNIPEQPPSKSGRNAERADIGLLLRPISYWEIRLQEIASRPRRHPALHWSAFVLSLVSFTLPLFFLIHLSTNPYRVDLFWLDVGLSVFFAFELFTRSGFRWNHTRYLITHAFEFIAIAPALVLVHYGVIYEYTWVWLILVARGARALDRLLGDGFIERNLLAIVEGIEEEITDRVLLRILERVQEDLDRAKFGRALAIAIAKNKEAMLARARKERPIRGIGGGIARVTGLNGALLRTEERVYDSIVSLLGSDEMDRTIRESIDSAFDSMRHEIAVKSWKKRMGVQNEAVKGTAPDEETKLPAQAPPAKPQ